MLQTVVLETANPMTLRIGEADPDELLILTSISGLDPADVSLFTGEYASEGGYYQGRRVGRRNPVFNFKINPDYKNNVDASDARALLYRQFLDPLPESDRVQVRLIDDRNPDRYFQCYTEKMPADIFAEKPTAQVSTLSVDAYLKSVEPSVGSNPTGWLSVPLSYDGTADSGLELTIKVVSVTKDISVENNGLRMRLYKAGSFVQGDIITIGTEKGSRFVRLNGIDAMSLLQGTANWITLTQASNALRAYGSAISDGKAVITNYMYRSSWWGV